MPLASALETSLLSLRKSMRAQRAFSTLHKNKVLNDLASALENRSAEVLAANSLDLANLDPSTTPAFRDRLILNPQRIKAMAESLRQVAALPDPVGEIIEDRVLKNGLRLKKVRAPLGLILMIFESRPNVILEAFSLAFKSGNSIVLRGGSESSHSASALYAIMKDIFKGQAFLGVEDYDRAHIGEMLKRSDLIDIVVPRGGERLIRFVQENATMPIIKNDRGLCHAFVDEDADLDMALNVVVNAKVSRPAVCNSLETVLVHAGIAKDFLPRLYQAMPNVDWRVDEKTLSIFKTQSDRIKIADSSSWDTEYLDLVLNCRVVDGLEQALEHIEQHGSRHSETILTRSEEKARRFQNEVDAAAVYWNASTRFTDGFEFGLGGELGISTQKLHVRGPVGLRELTTPRWIIDGNGQIR